MANRGAKLTIDVAPFRQFRTQLTRDFTTKSGKIGVVVLDKWPKHYFEFLRARYRKNAAGGGDWPPISPRTRSGKKRKGILRVTDTLYNALLPNNPGNVIRPIKDGIRCGISEGRHPDSKLSIGNLAALHAAGSSKGLPQRVIVVEPDQQTITAMKIAAERGFAEFIRSFKASQQGKYSQSFGVNKPRNR